MNLNSKIKSVSFNGKEFIVHDPDKEDFSVKNEAWTGIARVWDLIENHAIEKFGSETLQKNGGTITSDIIQNELNEFIKTIDHPIDFFSEVSVSDDPVNPNGVVITIA